ncbi:MAG: molybdopterin-dependent oxidoreductase [Candidatus Margulisiibacteriota bacterium]
MVEKKKSICLFCSLGCGVAFRTSGEHVIAIDYDKENPINNGSLCPRGHYNFELLNHPYRLTEPQIGKRKVSWSEALSFLGHRLKEFDPDSVGIVLSSISSNEDAYLAAKLAKVLGIKNICAAGDPADLEAYQGYKWEVAGAELSKVEEIGKGEALLVIGDILTRSPVLSKRVNQVKYGKRGNKIIVIDPNKTHTSWFATTHLANRPGTEALLLAAMIEVIAQENKKGKIDINLEKAAKTVGISQEAIIKAAKDFNRAASGTIIFVPGPTKQRNDLINYFIKILASLSANKKYITFYGFGNNLGVNTVLDQMLEGHASYPEILKKIEKGQLKALLMLGEDISASHPDLGKKIRNLKFIAMSNYFTTDLVDEAVLLLPLASHLECSATYTLADGSMVKPGPVAPKVGAKSNLEIIASLLSTEVGLEKISQETKEVLSKGAPLEKVDLKQKLSEAQKITTKEQVPQLNISHFGNNALVKNFFWYKVNNKGG